MSVMLGILTLQGILKEPSFEKRRGRSSEGIEPEKRVTIIRSRILTALRIVSASEHWPVLSLPFPCAGNQYKQQYWRVVADLKVSVGSVGARLHVVVVRCPTEDGE